MINQRACCTAVRRRISAKKKKKWFREWGKKKKKKRSSLFKIMLSRFKEDARNSHDVGRFTFRRVYHFLCLNKALRKATVHMFPPAPPNTRLPDCTGDGMAPRVALMPLVIICDTQLSLESCKQQPETFQGAAGARAYLPAQWSR